MKYEVCVREREREKERERERERGDVFSAVDWNPDQGLC